MYHMLDNSPSSWIVIVTIGKSWIFRIWHQQGNIWHCIEYHNVKLINKHWILINYWCWIMCSARQKCWKYITKVSFSQKILSCNWLQSYGDFILYWLAKVNYWVWGPYCFHLSCNKDRVTLCCCTKYAHIITLEMPVLYIYIYIWEYIYIYGIQPWSSLCLQMA